MRNQLTARPVRACLVGLLVATAVSGGEPKGESRLLVDPLLIARAGEVWSVLATRENEVWPGWNAASTPLLLYLPGEQDVLINHPRPPSGFVPYTGPIEFPFDKILVKTGPTIIEYDGQNTSRTISGVRTLIVADTLSNHKMNIEALIRDPRPASEKVDELSYEVLATDPYDSMGMVAHEAFHVYQHVKAPNKGGDESALRTYPVLSVENNVGVALEGVALADVLLASSEDDTRKAALRWLAVRRDRRANLPRESIRYEDGTEFNEGLAKYVEYRLTQALEGRSANEALYMAQGFHGYDDMSSVRHGLIDRMRRFLAGEINVNNDPYGASPVRMRLYYSGMGIARLFDKISPGWHRKIFKGRATLTKLATTALRASDAELADALSAARSDTGYDALVVSKKELQVDGQRHVEAMLAGIKDGENGTLTVDYSALGRPKLSLAYTPFGVTSVDQDRTIYGLVPVRANVPQRCNLKQSKASPLLSDQESGLLQMAFVSPLTPGQRKSLEKAGAVPLRLACEPRASRRHGLGEQSPCRGRR